MHSDHDHDHDHDSSTVFAELAAGTKIAYLLNLHVHTPSAFDGPDDYRTIRMAVRDIMLPAQAPTPARKVSRAVAWQMPNATSTCNLFYLTEADASSLIYTLTVVTADTDADMHMEVQDMVDRIERRVKTDHPECGGGGAWRLVYLLTKPAHNPYTAARPVTIN